MKFKDLEPSDIFSVFGDVNLNYNYPKICICIKINETTGQEIGGIRFCMNPLDDVHKEN